MKVEVNGTLVNLHGSIPYPIPGWNTGGHSNAPVVPRSGDYLRPEAAFFGNGGLHGPYSVAHDALAIMRLEHAPYIDAEAEAEFRAAELEKHSAPGYSQFSPETWAAYWHLPVELLRPFDQIRLIEYASSLGKESPTLTT